MSIFQILRQDRVFYIITALTLPSALSFFERLSEDITLFCLECIGRDMLKTGYLLEGECHT